MTYVRKTYDQWDIETNYGYGWEVESSYDNYKEAKADYKEYCVHMAHCGGCAKLVKRRIKKETAN